MPVAGRFLEERRGYRVVRRRVRARDEGDVGVRDVAVDRRHGAGADRLEQRRDARRVAEPRAVVHVVRAEGGAHHLLEEVRLLVAALGAAEAGQRGWAVLRLDAAELAGDEVERLVPRRLAETRRGHVVVLEQVDDACDGVCRRLPAHVAGERLASGSAALLADERLGQAVGVRRVVEAVAALHAEPRPSVPELGAALRLYDDLVGLLVHEVRFTAQPTPQ